MVKYIKVWDCYWCNNIKVIHISIANIQSIRVALKSVKIAQQALFTAEIPNLKYVYYVF